MSLVLNFLVVGAQKSGTTTLHEILQNIGGVNLPKNKETHYFSNQYEKGEGWYENQFLYKPDEFDICGEIDPEYMVWPGTAMRIYGAQPSVKIVIILRDSIKRAYSQYTMSVRRGLENRRFHEALENEYEKYKDNILISEYSESEMFSKSYLKRSLYSSQVEEYVNVFGRNNVHIMQFEKLVNIKTSDSELERFFEFVGIESAPKELDIPKANKTESARFAFLNRILWDKGSYKSLRSLARLVIPERYRSKISQQLYGMNRSNNEKAFDSMDLRSIDKSIVAFLREDAEKLSDFYGVDVNGWSCFGER